MKNNALVVVGAVFLLLLVGWFITKDSGNKVGIKELKVERIKPDDVSKIEVTIPGKETKKNEAAPDEGPVESTKEPAKTVVLERDGKSFVVSDGKSKKHPVEESQLKPLLDAIGELQAGDVVANKAEKLKEFEIEDTTATRVIITTSTNKKLDLLFGRAAKGGGTTVREQGSNDVFVAKGRLGTLAKKEASAWRKKTIVDKKAEDFTSVTVARADSKLVLTAETKEEAPASADAPAAKASTTWKLTEPSELPAGYRLDEGAVGRIASSIAALRATDFADDVDDAKAGLVGPHTIVTAATKDGNVVVHFGGRDDKKRVYTKLDGDAQIYLVADYAAKNVDKGLDDLRDLSLFTVKLDEVTQATISSGKTKIVVKKDGAEWKLVDPKTAPPDFDATQISAVVGGFTRLKGLRLAADVKDAGGSDPFIELVTATKKESVSFGGPVPVTDGKPEDKPKEGYAKGADGSVYVVSSFTKSRYEKVNELFKKPPAPPPGMQGAPGGISGLDGLPPDVRKKLEASLKNKGLKAEK